MTLVVSAEECQHVLGDTVASGGLNYAAMGKAMAALVAERWAARERALNAEHAEQQLAVAAECDRQTAERMAAAVKAAVASALDEAIAIVEAEYDRQEKMVQTSSSGRQVDRQWQLLAEERALVCAALIDEIRALKGER